MQTVPILLLSLVQVVTATVGQMAHDALTGSSQTVESDFLPLLIRLRHITGGFLPSLLTGKPQALTVRSKLRQCRTAYSLQTPTCVYLHG